MSVKILSQSGKIHSIDSVSIRPSNTSNLSQILGTRIELSREGLKRKEWVLGEFEQIEAWIVLRQIREILGRGICESVYAMPS